MRGPIDARWRGFCATDERLCVVNVHFPAVSRRIPFKPKGAIIVVLLVLLINKRARAERYEYPMTVKIADLSARPFVSRSS